MRRLAAVLAALALLPACTGDSIEIAAGDPLPARELGGGCPEDDAADRPPFAFGLAERGTWLRVDSIDTGRAWRRERDYRGTYVPIGGDPGVPVPEGAIRMERLRANAIKAALKAGASVWLRVGRAGEINLAYAVRGDEYAFLGRCQYAFATEAAAAWLGPYAVMYLARFPGQSSDAMKRTLGYDASVNVADPGNAMQRLSGGGPPREVVEALPGMFVDIAVPKSWRLGVELCPRSRLGVSRCAYLGGTDRSWDRFLYDPSRPVVELFVRRRTDRHLGHRLVEVDLAALAAKAGLALGGKEELALHVRLKEPPTVRTVVASPLDQSWPRAVASVRIARWDYLSS